MTLSEIEDTINNKSLTPKLLSEAMMKQITWSDQWIGYDDQDTFKLKQDFAEEMCFGGLMFWSVDFYPSKGR